MWSQPKASTTARGYGNTTTTVTMWLSGGTDGVNYNAVCHITTSGARQDDRTIRILCRQR